MPWEPSKNETVSGKRSYEFVEFVDSGGIANVWRATTSDGDDVVVKYPNLSGSNDISAVRSYFDQERETLDEIARAGGHPNVMEFVEEFRANDRQFIVAGYVDGQDVQEWIRKDGPLAPDTVHDIGVRLCDAMAFLHENEIIYRDLKPDNVMLADGRTPVLIDFNTAKAWDPTAGDPKCPQCGEDVKLSEAYCPNCGQYLAETEVGSGTPFKPVEISEPRQHPEIPQGPWSDVYSVGKLMTYMLAGSVPPRDGIDVEALGITCPDYLATIIRRATSTDHGERYRNARELKYALVDEDPSRSAVARLRCQETSESFHVRPGDTLGRSDANGPAAAVTIDDPSSTDKHISAIQVQFDRDADDRWVLRDRSLNGTYVDSGTGWRKIHHEAGQQRLRRKGGDPELPDGSSPPESTTLTIGDRIALVDPSYGVTLEFEPA